MTAAQVLSSLWVMTGLKQPDQSGRHLIISGASYPRDIASLRLPAHIFGIQHFIDRPDNRSAYLHVRATWSASPSPRSYNWNLKRPEIRGLNRVSIQLSPPVDASSLQICLYKRSMIVSRGTHLPRIRFKAVLSISSISKYNSLRTTCISISWIDAPK